MTSCPPPSPPLQWDPSGDQLAILPNGNTIVIIWTSANKDQQRIETEFKVGPWLGGRSALAVAWLLAGCSLACVARGSRAGRGRGGLVRGHGNYYTEGGRGGGAMGGSHTEGGEAT